MPSSTESDSDEKSIGVEESDNMNSVLRRYSNAVDLGTLEGSCDDLSEDVSDDHIKDTVGAATQTMLQPLRDQVANMGIDVAVLDETLQTLIAQTEGANKKLTQVTNFVVDLIERLEDIDTKARALTDKWTEESRVIYDFTDHADEVSERFASTIAIQEEKIGQLTVLLETLTEETSRLSTISGPRQLPAPATPHAVKELLVEEPEMVDFKSKKAAFFALAEQRKTNDTYQSFKATRKTSAVTRSSGDLSEKSQNLEQIQEEVVKREESSSEINDNSTTPEIIPEPESQETEIQETDPDSLVVDPSAIPEREIKITLKFCVGLHFLLLFVFLPFMGYLLCTGVETDICNELRRLFQRVFQGVIASIQGSSSDS